MNNQIDVYHLKINIYRLSVMRRPHLVIGEHMIDVRLSLVVTKLLWIPQRMSAPNLPNAPSHLCNGLGDLAFMLYAAYSVV